jgi:hypothetical protein
MSKMSKDEQDDNSTMLEYDQDGPAGLTALHVAADEGNAEFV